MFLLPYSIFEKSVIVINDLCTLIRKYPICYNCTIFWSGRGTFSIFSQAKLKLSNYISYKIMTCHILFLKYCWTMFHVSVLDTPNILIRWKSLSASVFTSLQGMSSLKPISFLCPYLLIYNLENTAVGFKVMILCQNFVFSTSTSWVIFIFMRILNCCKIRFTTDAGFCA